MPTSQQTLQHKLSEITKKFQLIYQNYINLKQIIKNKDQEISRLKLEINRFVVGMGMMSQCKENNRVEDLRRRYQGQGVFIGGGGRGGIMGGEKFVDRIGNISNNGLQTRTLAQSKSLNSYQFTKSQNLPSQPLTYQFPNPTPVANPKHPNYPTISKNLLTNNSLQNKIQQNLSHLSQYKNSINAKTNLNGIHLPMGTMGTGGLERSPNLSINTNQLLEIDRRYERQLKQRQIQRSRSKQKQRQRQRQAININNLILNTNTNRHHHNPSTHTLHNHAHGYNKQTETQLLKQLWQERDKEIRRMDDLFQSLNNKIKNV